MRERSVSLKTINTSEHNFMVIMKYPNDNALGQFTYFIVAICSNSLKVSFCKEKQSQVLHSRFYQRFALNTKKSDICRLNFNADLYYTSINITDETNPRSQSNCIIHVKRHYVMNPICGR